MNLIYQTTIPIKLISEANNRDHWTKKSKRSQVIKMIVRADLMKFKSHWRFPLSVVLTRIGRKLDEDNLAYAFKAIRDEIADYILPGMAKGRADSDPRITWHYQQETAKLSGFRIDIYECFPVLPPNMPRAAPEHTHPGLQPPMH
jgi:hypothetical protein